MPRLIVWKYPCLLFTPPPRRKEKLSYGFIYNMSFLQDISRDLLDPEYTEDLALLHCLLAYFIFFDSMK